jgi:pyruvate kinase
LQVHAKIIVVLASSGNAARYIAKYRPSQPIVVGVVPVKRRAVIGFTKSDVNGTSEEQVARQCLLTRGLMPVVVSDHSEVRPAQSIRGVRRHETRCVVFNRALHAYITCGSPPTSTHTHTHTSGLGVWAVGLCLCIAAGCS